MINRRSLFSLLFSATAAKAQRRKFYTYVRDLGPNYVELAWGTADGVNTFGRSAPSFGDATIHIADRTIASQLNYVTVGGLEPDHTYTYKVSLAGSPVGEGSFRTWAAQADRLSFFVIGDYGTGRDPQYAIANAMWQEFQRRMTTENPVRFVLTVGDNIYGNVSSFLLGIGHTGAHDTDWAPKFLDPFQPMIGRIPIFPTLGNHDGNETESRGDLAAYLDNMPFPGGKPARYYTFNYGGLADFFGLDSTANTESGSPHPAYLENSPQFHWMQQAFPKSQAPWKIPYYHHPPFNAGPLHASGVRDFEHWLNLFGHTGVKAGFCGHEHNFQASEVNEFSRGIRFFTSGAGGELRPGNILSSMKKYNVRYWSPQHHFLAVDIVGKNMNVTPLSYESVTIRDSDNNVVKPPLSVSIS